jgi:hypothetical protein
MKLTVPKTWRLILLLVTVFALLYLIFPNKPKIDFNTQVKPIFNQKCISCHGGVKQQGNFSLLFREESLQKTKSGKYGIVPGSAAQSELIKRIKHKDADERMPYKHAPLSKKEIDVLEQWIDEGAHWGQHWAYVPVQQQTIPGENSKWIVNDIDRFVYHKLKEEKLQPSPQADKSTLLRRVSLDLTGLPPGESIAKKFLNNSTSFSYENLVDTLLQSPAYGEKWTSLWLDLARYADTRGYEADMPRGTIWRYRDWLIKAFNADKPYNIFLTEQLAGDLMPGANDEMLIATALHRNTLTNDEGGTDNEEFRVSAVMDRINTTWSAFMGTTFNCVQCHSHPYDPFKHEEYYKFMAFFNNTRDEDTEKDYPLLRQYTGADSATHAALLSWFNKYGNNAEKNWYSFFLKTLQPSVNLHLCDNYKNGVLYQNNYASLDKGGSCRLPGINTGGNKQLIFRFQNNGSNAKVSIYMDSTGGRLLQSILLPDTKMKWSIFITDIPEVKGKRDLYLKYDCSKVYSEQALLLDWFAFSAPFPGIDKPGYALAKKQFAQLLSLKPEATPVMIENTAEQHRETFVFERGNWTVKTKLVQPGVPGIMNPMPVNAPPNRLGLALWLTDKKNPLTARTMVNRLWEQLFGAGLAETLEDLGTQGSPPVYKEMLDHLAWKFMYDYNWSIKKLLKEIVTSAVYRQSSAVNAALYNKDPNNTLLARQSRIRLTGEQIRDQCLAVSNLLNKKMYGKSVMPWQPDGIWSSPYNDLKWETSKGDTQYRRAVYTYWKRTAPYPSMINFDGASREVCVTRRIRTNTPLQALNSLNDSAYIVMARSFANLMMASGNGIKQQIAFGYEQMMFEPISERKLSFLLELYTRALDVYSNDHVSSAKMQAVKLEDAKPTQAAMIVVANAMFNLDEWVNKK